MKMSVEIDYAGAVGGITEVGGKPIPSVVMKWQHANSVSVDITEVRRHDTPEHGAWLSITVPRNANVHTVIEQLMHAVDFDLYWDRIGPGTQWGNDSQYVLVGVTNGDVTTSRQRSVPRPSVGYEAPAPGSGIREWGTQRPN